MRLTLAVRYILPEKETLDILKFLLQRLHALGIVSRALYLDKDFAAGPVVRYLQEQHQPDHRLSHPRQKWWHPWAVQRLEQLHHPLHQDWIIQSWIIRLSCKLSLGSTQSTYLIRLGQKSNQKLCRSGECPARA